MNEPLVAKQDQEKILPPDGFVGHARLLELVWTDAAARPSLKWLHNQRAKRLIPFCRFGRLIFYNPAKVRESLERRFEVSPVGKK
jgi:hypothetical protein